MKKPLIFIPPQSLNGHDPVKFLQDAIPNFVNFLCDKDVGFFYTVWQNSFSQIKQEAKKEKVIFVLQTKIIDFLLQDLAESFGIIFVCKHEFYDYNKNIWTSDLSLFQEALTN